MQATVLLVTAFNMCGNQPNGLFSMPYEQIPVECYSGYKANERPVVFTFRERRWEIAEVVDRWYEGGIGAGRPQANYFKIRTTEGNVFLLRYLAHSGAWSIQI